MPQIILYICSFSIVYFLFHGTLLHQLYRWTQITGLTIFLSISIVLFLIVEKKEITNLGTIFFFLFYLLTRIIILGIILWLKNKKKIQYVNLNDYRGLTIQLSLVIILIVIFVYLIVNLFANIKVAIKDNLVYIFALLFLAISLLIINIFYSVINIANKLSKEKIINFENRVEVEYTKVLNKKIDTLHRLRHDVKDQFIMINYYLKNNEYEKLRKHISKLQYPVMRKQ